jgi:hypothetical protein
MSAKIEAILAAEDAYARRHMRVSFKNAMRKGW